MTDWVCLVMVVLAYAIGHFSGFKMCKLRVKNMLRKRINYRLMNVDQLDAYGSMLGDVMKM